jgi:hypothetical protein
MKQATEIIKYARQLVNDEQKTGYADFLMLDCLNAAIRFMWRHITKIRPAIIAETVSGSFNGGVIYMTGVSVDGAKPAPRMMLKVVDVEIGGRHLRHIDMLDAVRANAESEPERYYRLGFDKICVYPKAKEETEYKIIAVFDAPKIAAMTEITPFPDVFDDFLTQYVVIRLSYKNEFNMSQEEGIMATVISQIEQILYDFENTRPAIDGYFDRHEDY